MICIQSSWCHCHPIISCFIKIKNGLTFLVLAYPGCPGKVAAKLVSVLTVLLAVMLRQIDVWMTALLGDLIEWFHMLFRSVWVMEDWQIQKLSTEHPCRPHRENPCTDTTMDTRLPSSEVLYISLQSCWLSAVHSVDSKLLVTHRLILCNYWTYMVQGLTTVKIPTAAILKLFKISSRSFLHRLLGLCYTV